MRGDDADYEEVRRLGSFAQGGKYEFPEEFMPMSCAIYLVGSWSVDDNERRAPHFYCNFSDWSNVSGGLHERETEL